MFSKTTEYALRATFYIAQKGTRKNKLPIQEIAKAIGSPQPFTAKILQTLVKHNNVISSTRGPRGGFFMTEKAKQQSVTVILEAMNEKQTLTKCVLGMPQCSSDNPCPMHVKYFEIKDQLIQMFDTTTIGEVAGNLESHPYFLGLSKANTDFTE